MKTINKIKKQTKHQKQLVMARIQERAIHRTVMATHQALLQLWYGQRLPKELEEMAIEKVFEALQTAEAGAEKFDLLAFLAPLVTLYKEQVTGEKEAEGDNV